MKYVIDNVDIVKFTDCAHTITNMLSWKIICLKLISSLK